MNRRLLRSLPFSLWVFICGCSSSDSEPSPSSTLMVDDKTTDTIDIEKTAPAQTGIDPAVDAGMMADQFEQSQRLNLTTPKMSDTMIEMAPEPKD